jgi:hypothetical protein
MALTDRIFGQNLSTMSSLGGGLGTSGATDIGMSSNFFRTLLGGNRQAIMQQAAPGLNAAREAADAAKRDTAARTTARTGGNVAANQQTEDELRKSMDTLIGGEQATAAQSLASNAGTQLSTMANLLSSSTQSAQQDIQQRNMAKAALLSALIGAPATIAGGWLAGR